MGWRPPLGAFIIPPAQRAVPDFSLGGTCPKLIARYIRGTRVAALFYSLIESPKLCGVEPRAYLGEAARRAIRDPGTVTLPRDLK